MADCRTCQPDLKAYCDQELSWPRRLVVRRHLARCAQCRQEVAAMTQIAEQLCAAEKSAPNLDAGLRARLLAAAPPPAPAVPRGNPLFRPVSGWYFAAIAVSAIVLYAVLFPVFATARHKVIASMPTASFGDRLALSAQHNIAMQAQPVVPPSGLSANPMMTRQVHKDATLGVQVADPEAGSDQVAQMVKTAGGYVAGNTLSTNPDGTKVASLTVDVPVAQFDTVLTQIGKLGDVQSKNITGQDITDQVSDSRQAEQVLEDQVRQAQARLSQLGKHASWDDTDTARNLAIQLAQARARLALEQHLGQLSDIQITLTQTPKPPPPVQSGFLSSLHGTTGSALQSLLSSLGIVLTLMIWTLAYAPIWLPLFLLGRWIYRRLQSAPSPIVPSP